MAVLEDVGDVLVGKICSDIKIQAFKHLVPEVMTKAVCGIVSYSISYQLHCGECR